MKAIARFNIEFAGLLLAAFVFSYIPFVNIPFRWIMTYFHEISHGIAAIVTGGSVDKIHLHLLGSGLCYTLGGNGFLISLAGYCGAVLWGMLIYEMADEISHKSTNLICLFLTGLIVLTGLLYGRDIITWAILLFIGGLFLSIMKLQEALLMKWALKFIGLFVLLDAVRAPLHLIDGRHYGDGARLSDLTGLPEILWVLLWLGFGILGLIFLWKMNQKAV